MDRRVNISRAPKVVCVLDRSSERQMKWVRENLSLWTVSGAARNETWHVDDNCFWDTKMCNPELFSLSHACSRYEMWSCCATLHVLFLWVYCSQIFLALWMNCFFCLFFFPLCVRVAAQRAYAARWPAVTSVTLHVPMRQCWRVESSFPWHGWLEPRMRVASQLINSGWEHTIKRVRFTTVLCLSVEGQSHVCCSVPRITDRHILVSTCEQWPVESIVHCTISLNETENVPQCQCSSRFQPDCLDIRTFLSNCNDTLIIATVQCLGANTENRISLSDTIDPSSLLHDVLWFDLHAVVTFTSVSSMNFSADRAFVSRHTKNIETEVEILHAFLACSFVPLHKDASCNIDSLVLCGSIHRAQFVTGFHLILVIGLPTQPLLLESRQISARFVLQLLQNANNLTILRQALLLQRRGSYSAWSAESQRKRWCRNSCFRHVEEVWADSWSILFTPGPAAAPQHLARLTSQILRRPRVERAFPHLLRRRRYWTLRLSLCTSLTSPRVLGSRSLAVCSRVCEQNTLTRHIFSHLQALITMLHVTKVSCARHPCVIRMLLLQSWCSSTLHSVLSTVSLIFLFILLFFIFIFHVGWFVEKSHAHFREWGVRHCGREQSSQLH